MSVSHRRAQNKKPPQQREQKQEPQKPLKRTLQEHCKDLSQSLASARRQKLEVSQRERYKKEADEVMVLCYGPNWRDRYLEDGCDPVPIEEAS